VSEPAGVGDRERLSLRSGEDEVFASFGMSEVVMRALNEVVSDKDERRSHFAGVVSGGVGETSQDRRLHGRRSGTDQNDGWGFTR
jgi:hypothetical protein